jgi:putative iron-only hydrogenase system regulator
MLSRALGAGVVFFDSDSDSALRQCGVTEAEMTEKKDDTRIAVIAIIVDEMNSVGQLNSTLHEYANYIIGRMGLPYRAKNTHIISVAVDAPEAVINALAGKLGMIQGVMSRTVYGKV